MNMTVDDDRVMMGCYEQSIENVLFHQMQAEDALRAISEDYGFVEVINNLYQAYDEANSLYL